MSAVVCRLLVQNLEQKRAGLEAPREGRVRTRLVIHMNQERIARRAGTTREDCSKSELITWVGSLVYVPNSSRIPPKWDNEPPLDIDELYGTAKACLA